MIYENVTLIFAFFAGILSFISPCVLPLIPSYISYISGISYDKLISGEEVEKLRKTILLNSISFICGFTLVFMAIGAAFSFLGQLFFQHQDFIRKIGAMMIIFMGLHVGLSLCQTTFDSIQAKYKARYPLQGTCTVISRNLQSRPFYTLGIIKKFFLKFHLHP